MNELPWFRFYPADWIKGTRGLTNDQKAIWIDLLCFMWESPSQGSFTTTWEVLSRQIGLALNDARIEICALFKMGVLDLFCADCGSPYSTCPTPCPVKGTHLVRVLSRRMSRECLKREAHRKTVETSRESERLRKMAYRQNLCDRNVTDKKSEVRSQKSVKDSSVVPKNGTPHTPPASPPKDPKLLTEVQRVVTAWKVLTGYPKEDTSWDKINFHRCTKSAKALLEFIGRPDDVIDCLQDVYEKLNGKGFTVTIETVVKHASDWKKDRLERRPSGVLLS